MRRTAALLIVNVAVTLLILVSLEGGSRLLTPVALPEPLVFPGNPEWAGSGQYDRLLFWRMRPGIEHGGEIYTNSLGLRGPEVPAKDAGEFRILSLGESTTFARRLPYEKSYSSLLETEITSVAGKAVRVVNAGVPAYTSFQGYQYLRFRGIALDPDAVLVYFGYNDFLPIAYRAGRGAETHDGAGGWTDRQLFEQRNTLRFRLTDVLLRHSNLARLVLWLGLRDDGGVTTGSIAARVPDPDRRWVLQAFRRFCQEHGLRLVVIIPIYREFDHHIPVLREVARWQEVTLVDLPAALAGRSDTRSRWFVDRVHPTAEGHRWIAHEIAKALRESWQLEPLDGS